MSSTRDCKLLSPDGGVSDAPWVLPAPPPSTDELKEELDDVRQQLSGAQGEGTELASALAAKEAEADPRSASKQKAELKGKAAAALCNASIDRFTPGAIAPPI